METSHRVTPKKWPQYLAACLAAISSVTAGAVIGWSSPALPLLQEKQNNTKHMVVTDDEASWVGSLMPLGALIGAVPAGILANHIGRKSFLLATTILYLGGWILLAMGRESILMLYIGRFILGLATGSSTTVIPIYNEEIAEDSIRGFTGSLMDLSWTVGILWIYGIGAVLPYPWISASTIIIPCIFFLTFMWMPESPIYLLSKGSVDKAEAAVRWLRGVDIHYDITEIVDQMKLLLKVNNGDKEGHSMIKKMKFSLKHFSMRSVTLKSTFIVLGLMFFQQMSGYEAIVFYTVQIFQDAGSSLSPVLATFVIGIVQVVFTAGAAMVVDKLGRKMLLILSEVLMVISLASLSVFSWLKEDGSDISDWNWIPLAALNLFCIAFSIGFGPIPWFMMAEIVPTHAKGIVSGIGVCFNWLLVFLVTNQFPALVKIIAYGPTYGILAVICITGIFFVALCVPETCGKTKEDILESLGKRKDSQNIHK